MDTLAKPLLDAPFACLFLPAPCWLKCVRPVPGKFQSTSDDSIIEMSLLLDWLERTNYKRQKKKKRLRKNIYGRQTFFWKKRRYLGNFHLVLILYLSKNFCLSCKAISGTHFIWSWSWSVHSQPQLKIWAHKRGKYWCLIFCYFYPWYDIYMMILCSKL